MGLSFFKWDQATEETANENTQTASVTKGYGLKSDVVVRYSITADYRHFFGRLEKW